MLSILAPDLNCIVILRQVRTISGIAIANIRFLFSFPPPYNLLSLDQIRELSWAQTGKYMSFSQTVGSTTNGGNKKDSRVL